MITLCCAPDWMKGGEPGFTNWSTLEVGPVYIGHSESAQVCAQENWIGSIEGTWRWLPQNHRRYLWSSISCFHFSGGSTSGALPWLCQSCRKSSRKVKHILRKGDRMVRHILNVILRKSGKKVRATPSISDHTGKSNITYQSLMYYDSIRFCLGLW